LPDLDVFFPGHGLEGLVTHRGFSHSLLGVAIGAVAVAWFAQKLKLKHLSFSQLYVAAIFGMLMHKFFDVVTTYGTLVFMPFSDYRVALDVLFIIDPYLDILLIASLLLGWRWFVRVPVVQEIEGDGDFLLVQDLQFMPRPEGLGWLGLWAARLVLDHQFGVFERTIFALEIELDDLNNVRKIIYLGQNGERHPL